MSVFGVFLVRIFPHSDYSVFLRIQSTKYGPQKLPIRTLFMQWFRFKVQKYILCYHSTKWYFFIDEKTGRLPWNNFQKSLFENSVSMSDWQRILLTAVENFCNLLMLSNLYFIFINNSQYLIYLNNKNHKVQITDFAFISNVFIVPDGHDRNWWK